MTALDALLLDFDGVVLESNEARTRGYELLFADQAPADLAALLEFHRRNGGLSRYRKIEHFHREILKRPITTEERDALAARFSAIVVDLVLACPFVPGARALVETSPWPLFLVSGSDQTELRAICAKLGIAARFREILGSPADKPELIAGLLARHRLDPRRVVYVGDAPNDLDAARANGLGFVARAPSGRPSWVPEATPLVASLDELPRALRGLLP